MINFKENDIEIEEEAPFKNDILEREEQIKNLTNLFDNIEGQFVFCINGPWGSGKTCFVKMWKYYLESHKYKTIYFNAWENDFSEDPFLPIVNEFMESNAQGKSEFKKASKNLLKILVPSAIKLATAGAIDCTDTVGQNIEDTISNLANSFIDEKFKEQKSKKKDIKKFKDELKKVVNYDNIQNGSGKNKFVFFIDELDRCKPTFAINLLERIKHIFDVEGIIFVVSIDKEQLGKTLSCVYGNDFDVNGYLARFFDFEYRLPNKSHFYIEHLLKKADYLHNYMTILDCYLKRLELRELQKWSKRLELSINILSELEINKGGRQLLIMLFIIRELDSTFYRELLNGTHSDNQVLNFVNNYFSYDEVPKNIGIQYFNLGLLVGSLFLALSDNEYKAKLADIKNEYNNKKNDRYKHSYYEGINKMMERIDCSFIGKELFKSITKKIEFTNGFKL